MSPTAMIGADADHRAGWWRLTGSFWRLPDPAPDVTLIYSCLFLSAHCTYVSVSGRIVSLCFPKIVPMEHLSNAIFWNGHGREMATMTGPALAGLLLAWLGSPVGVSDAGACASMLTMICYAR